MGQIFLTASLHRDHSILYALVCEKNRIHHWCSVGTETESQPRGLIVLVGNEACRSILFLIYHDRTVQYCVISVGDATEVDVYSQ